MDIFKKDATAFIELWGLGISSFCKKDGYFEEAFLRDIRHTFRIKIEGPIKENGGRIGNIVDEIIEDFDDVQISIETIGRTETVGVKRHEPRPFNRLLPGNDPNDVRWVIGLGNELHGNDLVKNSVTRPPDKRPLSYVHIENAYFYALRTPATNTGQKPFFIKVVNGIPVPFGYLAESYGARIKASDGIKVTIAIGNRSIPVPPLHHVEGSPYDISISNVDLTPGAPATDLEEMMKFVADPSGKDVDLVPFRVSSREISEKHAKLFVSGQNYCHPGECTELCTHDLIP